MAEPAASESLAALAEAWLGRRSVWRAHRLPPALMALYEAEKVERAYRLDVTYCVIGLLNTLLFYPMVHATFPNLGTMFDRLYLWLMLPAVVAQLGVILSRPGPLWRELALGLPLLVAMGLFTFLYWAGGDAGSVLYVALTLMLMLFATISVHLRFSLAVAWVVVVEILFEIGLAGGAGLSRMYVVDLSLIGLTCSAYMLLANRRMHQEFQRAFVFSFRDRLRQDALSAENRALDDLARRDALTGLANRRAYDSWLETLWVQASSSGVGTVGLIMLDVDHFKLYNDFYGHPAGDVCLATVGACLREQLRGTSDQVARIGGEEFAVLLPGVPPAQCADIAERLRAAVAAMELPHLGHESVRVVTISCGCASLKLTEAAPRDLCRTADAALYEAKQTGRNRICVGELSAQARANLAAGNNAVV